MIRDIVRAYEAGEALNDDEMRKVAELLDEPYGECDGCGAFGPLRSVRTAHGDADACLRGCGLALPRRDD